MKSKLLIGTLAAFTALCLPLSAERQLRAVWDKHPEKVTTIILANGVEIARKFTTPEGPRTEDEVDIIVPEGVVSITAVAENSLGERSEPCEPVIIPARPSTPRGFKIVINATVTVTPTP